MKKLPLLTLLAGLIVLLGYHTPLLAQQTHTLLMTGYKNVPKAETAASGEVRITLEGDSLSVVGSFSDLSSYYFGSAIFYGEKGERGNQVIKLNATVNENRTGGTFEKSKNTFKLTEGQLEALSEGNLYISVLSFDNTLGEIRAQLPPFN